MSQIHVYKSQSLMIMQFHAVLFMHHNASNKAIALKNDVLD